MSSTTSLPIVSLHGLAGVGKTHIALEYAYRFRETYQFIFWVSADDLAQEMRRLASLLGLHEQQEADTSLVIFAVKRWFHQHTNWLIVFDNVEDLQGLHTILPQENNGHILLTTTLPVIGFIIHHVEIPPMDLKEGGTFLLRKAKRIHVDSLLEDANARDREQAEAIVAELDGVSLALDQAAAYIEEAPCEIADYLERYRLRRALLLDRRGWSSTTHQISLATTLLLSFEKVAQKNPAAVDLLRLCAFLYANEIAEEMITEGAFLLVPSLQAVATDLYLLDEAIGALQRYSLVHRNREAKVVSLHRLVQVLLRETMEETQQFQWAEQAVRLVSHILPQLDLVHRHRFQRYSAQASHCLSWIEVYKMRSPEAARLVLWVGEYIIETSNDSRGEHLLQQALKLTLPLKPEHPVRQASINALAILYFNQGRYQDAEPLLKEVSEQSQNQISLNRATCLNNLGEVYYMQARYKEAEQHFLQALDIRTQLTETNDPSIAVSLCCLARLYIVQEKYEEAKPLLERSLSIREQTFERDHLAFAESFECLAELYLRQHMPKKATPLYQKAAEIYKKEQGPSHANLARCLRGVAETYMVQEQFEKAEAHFFNALAIYDQDERDADLDKAQVLRDLAWLYVLYHERSVEAEPLFLEALAIREQKIGIHPDTAAISFDLGRFYARLGNYPQAKSYYQQALAIYKETKNEDSTLARKALDEYTMLLVGLEEKYPYFTDEWFLLNRVGDMHRRRLSAKMDERKNDGGEETI